jgi:hypothetical protein
MQLAYQIAELVVLQVILPLERYASRVDVNLLNHLKIKDFKHYMKHSTQAYHYRSRYQEVRLDQRRQAVHRLVQEDSRFRLQFR